VVAAGDFESRISLWAMGAPPLESRPGMPPVAVPARTSVAPSAPPMDEVPAVPRRTQPASAAAVDTTLQ
jgi:hypothetical protein